MKVLNYIIDLSDDYEVCDEDENWEDEEFE